jgi:hypothetical protein
MIYATIDSDNFIDDWNGSTAKKSDSWSELSGLQWNPTNVGRGFNHLSGIRKFIRRDNKLQVFAIRIGPSYIDDRGTRDTSNFFPIFLMPWRRWA